MNMVESGYNLLFFTLRIYKHHREEICNFYAVLRM